MVIIVEDGTSKTDANSYVSESEFTTYATNRGITVLGTPSQLLLRAMDYIEAQQFKGSKKTNYQALQWPRVYVVIDEYDVSSTTIPQLLKDAQIEAALAEDAGTSLLSTVNPGVKKEKLGPMETEYKDGGDSTPFVRSVNLKLKKLISGGGFNILVERA